jgi:hypothetical protein
VLESGSKTTAEAVDYLMWRMLRVPAAKATRDTVVTFLTKELGTDSIDRAKTYIAEGVSSIRNGLRMLGEDETRLLLTCPRGWRPSMESSLSPCLDDRPIQTSKHMHGYRQG